MTLRLLAWDHPRATAPLAACAIAWREQTGEQLVVETRSLASFGDETPDPGRHDLVLIDHPHIGQAATAGAILALDELVGADTLAALEADSVEPPGVYRWRGSCWAIGVDSACQALALAGDVHDVPVTWSDVLELARRLPGRVALPLHPAHAVSSLLSLLAARGEQAGGSELATRASLEWATATLAELAAQGPADAFAWEPPDALALLARGELDCVPLAYCYVGYDVAWHDAPGRSPADAPGSILGGVGVAVLAGADDPQAAARLALWLASASVQREIVVPAGGQPARRGAWDDPRGDPMCASVRRTLTASRVRPRDPWWPSFQRASGELVVRELRAGRDPAALARSLEELYLTHRSLAA